MDLPNFGSWDLVFKKAGHFLGYAGLAFLALRAVLDWQRPYLAAAILIFLFSMSDEFHQTFIPGRNGTAVDVAIDMSGALTCLWLLHWQRQKQPSNSRSSVGGQ